MMVDPAFTEDTQRPASQGWDRSSRLIAKQQVEQPRSMTQTQHYANRRLSWPRLTWRQTIRSYG